MRKSREQLDAEMNLTQEPGPGEAKPPQQVATTTAAEGEQPPQGATPDPAPAPADAGPQSPPQQDRADDGQAGSAAAAISESAEPAPEQPVGPLSEVLQQRLLLVVESMLFVAGEPLAIPAMLKVLRNFHKDLSARQLRQVLERLRVELREQGRGVRLSEVAGGYQLRTPSEAAPYLRKLISRRPPRMTKATLETLAIVAYRQPVTRAEIEQIRGVDCGAVLRHLLEKQLVKIIGRKDEPGRPLLYGTTPAFLEFFSLKDLQSLPTLKDFAELSEDAQQQLGIQTGQQPEAGAAEEPLLDASDFDNLAPPGDDAVVQELAQALAEVSSHDRRLRKELKAQRPQSEQAAEPTGAAEQTDGATEQADGATEQTDAAKDNSDEPGSSGGVAGPDEPGPADS